MAYENYRIKESEGTKPQDAYPRGRDLFGVMLDKYYDENQIDAISFEEQGNSIRILDIGGVAVIVKYLGDEIRTRIIGKNAGEINKVKLDLEEKTKFGLVEIK